MATYPLYLYFNAVDINWYTEYQVNALFNDISPAEKENTKNLLSTQFENSFAILISIALTYIIVNVLIAYYLHLMTKSDEYTHVTSKCRIQREFKAV